MMSGTQRLGESQVSSPNQNIRHDSLGNYITKLKGINLVSPCTIYLLEVMDALNYKDQLSRICVLNTETNFNLCLLHYYFI